MIQSKKNIELSFLKKIGKLLGNVKRIRSFYSGAGYFGLAYTAFVSLEFAIHDALIEYISEFTESRDKSILNFLRVIEEEPKQDGEEAHVHTHWHNELLCSFAAGYVAAFFTNGIETVAVNK